MRGGDVEDVDVRVGQDLGVGAVRPLDAVPVGEGVRAVQRPRGDRDGAGAVDDREVLDHLLRDAARPHDSPADLLGHPQTLAGSRNGAGCRPGRRGCPRARATACRSAPSSPDRPRRRRPRRRRARAGNASAPRPSGSTARCSSRPARRRSRSCRRAARAEPERGVVGQRAVQVGHREDGEARPRSVHAGQTGTRGRADRHPRVALAGPAVVAPGQRRLLRRAARLRRRPSWASRGGRSRATTTTSRRTSTTWPSPPGPSRSARGSCSAGCWRRGCGSGSRARPEQRELGGQVRPRPRRPLLGAAGSPVERRQREQVLQDGDPPGGELVVGQVPVLLADRRGVGRVGLRAGRPARRGRRRRARRRSRRPGAGSCPAVSSTSRSTSSIRSSGTSPRSPARARCGADLLVVAALVGS